jgi:hypothetical protein
MLVNDTENHAHQGLATFLYKDGRVSNLRVQFVQQTAPYLLSPYCVLWGVVPLRVSAAKIDRLDAEGAAAKAELPHACPRGHCRNSVTPYHAVRSTGSAAR